LLAFGDWAARSTANHAAECERLARTLAKAQHHLDRGTKPRRRDPRPAQQVARQWRRPYIYSPEEVRRLLEIARAYPSPRSPLRPISLYTMLVLTYCAGLRLGELARLNLADIDLQVGTITIRETKFFKSRVPGFGQNVLAPGAGGLLSAFSPPVVPSRPGASLADLLDVNDNPLLRALGVGSPFALIPRER
jgi:Phage integrase family